METQPINKPIIIMYQKNDGKIETILWGSNDADVEFFALAIADIIGHVANRYDKSRADVLKLVVRENENLTTEINVV